MLRICNRIRINFNDSVNELCKEGIYYSDHYGREKLFKFNFILMLLVLSLTLLIILIVTVFILYKLLITNKKEVIKKRFAESSLFTKKRFHLGLFLYSSKSTNK